MDSELQELLGRTVTGLYVSDDQSLLVVTTDTGTLTFEAEGDCCSESWFADILGVEALLMHTVAAVEDVPLDDYNVKDGRGRQEEDAVYGHRLTTERGYADIIYRNSSNGYYGGWLNLVSYERDDPQNDARLKRILVDWRA